MYVFAYGSLTAETDTALPAASLAGFVRTWDVAMDNSVDIPGYKYYLDPVTGERPDVGVTFLNLTAQATTSCVGLLLPVTRQTLTQLDQRERNYGRVEVTDRISAALTITTRVYVYLGTTEARRRYANAVAAGSAVVASPYRDEVERGFARAGLLDAYLASTRPPECPVRELTRVDLPGRPGAPARGPGAA